MKLVLALILALAGLAGGAAVGAMLRPAPDPAEGATPPATDPPGPVEAADATQRPADYVTLDRQIIVPVLDGSETVAFMVLEVALDLPADERERVHARQPLLRDAFLRDLFELSQTGAFGGSYIADPVVAELKAKLLASARHHVSPSVREVLILDLLRKEL